MLEANLLPNSPNFFWMMDTLCSRRKTRRKYYYSHRLKPILSEYKSFFSRIKQNQWWGKETEQLLPSKAAI